MKVMEKPSLEMNIEDAQSLKIQEGELVKLSSPVGKTWKMKVHLSSMPDRGVIAVPLPCTLVGEERVCWVKVERLKAS